jgi:hypothetical protein
VLCTGTAMVTGLMDRIILLVCLFGLRTNGGGREIADGYCGSR